MLRRRRNSNIIRNFHEGCLMRKARHLKNYLLKIAQSLCIPEICDLWQPTCTKLKMDFRQKLFLKLSLAKQNLAVQ